LPVCSTRAHCTPKTLVAQTGLPHQRQDLRPEEFQVLGEVHEDMKVVLAARSSDIIAKQTVRPRAQVCSGPIAYIGQEELTADIENLKLALKDVAVEEVFITAIFPSNLELYYENRHYASSDEYLAALARKRLPHWRSNLLRESQVCEC
jgi:hypothetical protein